MQYVIPDNVYDVVKWLCALVLPALATLVGTIGSAWGMDASLCGAIMTTITAVATFGGAVLGISAATASEGVTTSVRDSVATDVAEDVANDTAESQLDEADDDALADEAEAMGKGEE